MRIIDAKFENIHDHKAANLRQIVSVIRFINLYYRTSKVKQLKHNEDNITHTTFQVIICIMDA